MVKDFILKYKNYALQSAAETGVPALFTLAQSALETGWGKSVSGNAMFGIKDTDGVNGNEQLFTTTEYHNRPNVKYPVIISIVEVIKGKRWKYKIKDWFRKYPSPRESFTDHGTFLVKNKRYSAAFNTENAYEFAEEVAKAGYATDPNYIETLKKVMKMIENEPTWKQL